MKRYKFLKFVHSSKLKNTQLTFVIVDDSEGVFDDNPNWGVAYRIRSMVDIISNYECAN